MKWDDVIITLIYLFTAVLGLMIVRWILKQLLVSLAARNGKTTAKKDAGNQSDEGGIPPIKISADAKRHEARKRQMIRFIENNPEDSARLIRAMLLDDKEVSG